MRNLRASAVAGLVEWWAKRDVNTFALSMVLAVPMAIVIDWAIRPSADDLSALVGVPVIVLYLFMRVVAAVSSRHEMSVTAHPHVFVRACSKMVAASVIVAIVAIVSWPIFSALGPHEGVIGALLVAALSVSVVLLGFACIASHEKIIAGHKIIFRPLIDRSQREISTLVEYIRHLVSRGQPRMFRFR